jgi:phosphatidylglycerol lysyltransferase
VGLESGMSEDSRSRVGRLEDRIPFSRHRLRRFTIIAWFVILAIAIVWLVFHEQADIRSTWERLRSADLRWIGVAILIQMLMLVLSGMAYKSILNRLGHQISLWNMTVAHLERTSISSVTPGGAPASVYIFVRYCLQHGVPAGDGFLTIAVRSIGIAITFVAVLIPGAALGRSTPGAIVALLLLAALIIGAMALWKGEQDNWETPLRWSRKLPWWARQRIQAFLIRFRDHGLKPDDLVPAILTALGVRITIIAVLWASLESLGQSPDWEVILRTYFASIVASSVIPVFGGAGAVEAATILTLTRAGVPGDLAVGATLLWRLIDLWIPAAIGLVFHARHELPAVVLDGQGDESMVSSGMPGAGHVRDPSPD